MVVEPVNTSAPGRVRCRGTRWPAESVGESFRRGQIASVAAVDNITLLVTDRSALNPHNVDAFAAVDSVAHMMPAKRSREKD